MFQNLKYTGKSIRDWMNDVRKGHEERYRNTLRQLPPWSKEIVGERREAAGGESEEEKSFWTNESFAVTRGERGQRGAVVENASAGSVFLWMEDRGRNRVHVDARIDVLPSL